ncbi:MAG: ferrochelatase [Ardenticatenaceae bacterium]|nr:ferrochelatase [Ardenticatenaceae bacterium]MCB8946626.1 ferrochelatase [Ardenticatenaceae bacterium]
MANYIRQSAYAHGEPQRTGILLVNLGTPEEPTAQALRPYLRQFLGDPRVIEWPAWLWKLILNGIILNVRPKKSAKLYQSIWTKDGSPLLVYSQNLANKLQANLQAEWGDNIRVALAMRYGRPSIADKLAEFRAANVQRILVLPLFPQYSATTTATIYDIVFDELRRYRWMPELRTVTDYHDNPLYIQALADSIRTFWAENGRSAKLLYSFHGIPKSYFEKGDPYYCFCQKTARLVSENLGLSDDEYQLCFQSRFGPEEWLQPYTDKTLEQWAHDGLTSVDTLCPGFAVDCLETLEEMAEQNREIFLEAGGQQYQYIPCLNDSDAQLKLFTNLAQRHLQGWEPAPGEAVRASAQAFAAHKNGHVKETAVA